MLVKRPCVAKNAPQAGPLNIRMPQQPEKRFSSRLLPVKRHAIEAMESRILLAAHIPGDATAYETIQAAVNAAAPGAVIDVDAGTYAERVTINKSLTILGAQAGVDARSNPRQAGIGESIVTGAALTDGSISCGFHVTANDVTIEGFTVEGNTSDSIASGAGIVIAPGVSGTHVLDNIVQNNVSGLFLANASATDAAVIQYNVFRNNNNSGQNNGRGIYTDATVSGGNLTNVTIDSNTFFENYGDTGVEAAVGLESATANSQSNIRITDNMMDSNGKSVLAYDVNNLVITGNVSTYNRDTPSGAMRFEGGDVNVTIQGNIIYANPGAAIRIDNKTIGANNSGFTITGNDIYDNGIDTNHEGLLINSGQYSGTLKAQNNWWGSASGPGGDGPGTGDRVYANGNGITDSPWATAPIGNLEMPEWGLASVAGAPIQAEDFDHGGAGIAFTYNVPINESQPYRPYENVAVGAAADLNGGYDLTATQAGELVSYTVNIPQTAAYRLDFRVASAQTVGGTFHVNIDGQDVTGAIAIPNTGGDQVWQTISESGVVLPAGQHVLQISFDSTGSGGYVGNLNWFQFAQPGAATVPTAPSNLAALGVSTSQVNLTWANADAVASSFIVQRSTDGVTFTTIATNVGANSFTDVGLQSGATYYYRVFDTNAVGSSTQSNVATAATLGSSVVSTPLSSLAWISATTGYGTIHKNLSVNGNPLTLRGTSYATGIGAHAVSQIAYNLGGQYLSFTSDVGVDEEVTGVGSVDFQVFGDGKLLFDSGVVTNNLPVVHVAVNVTGVQLLTLVASNGVPGSIDYDHADWAGAALLGIPAVPAAPSNLAASVSAVGQVNLTWTNNASNQTGFTLA
ncbi:MAG TPA: NPCBM/NEW2 domain-containing protein, partial [Tepidisphaeraceae bacterium]|nr:NPCBM/NEW2 domain-containing protein [Tepidisphaeraceae bacterium]